MRVATPADAGTARSVRRGPRRRTRRGVLSRHAADPGSANGPTSACKRAGLELDRGVRKHEQLVAGPRQPGVQRLGLAAARREFEDVHLRPGERAEQRHGVIRRAVRDEQDLQPVDRVAKCTRVRHLALDAGGFVVDGNDHRHRRQVVGRGAAVGSTRTRQGPQDPQRRRIPEVRVDDPAHREPEQDFHGYSNVGTVPRARAAAHNPYGARPASARARRRAPAPQKASARPMSLLKRWPPGRTGGDRRPQV